MGPDAIIFVFWMLSFKPTFSLSSFTFIKRLFSSSSFSVIRVVPSAYLRLLIFLLATLIPAYASSSPAFLMMYSACKLNKQGDNIQLWRTPCLIWNQSVVPCPVLTVASWLPIGFSRGRSCGLVFPSLSEFSTVYYDPHSQRLWHSQQSRNRCFFWNSLAFLMIQQMLAIWPLIPLPFLKPAWTSGSSWFTYCWSLWNKLNRENLFLFKS